jgi:hypothetical protein
MAEENAFDEVCGDRAAIHGDERLAAAIAGALQSAGENFLADAGFTFEEHGNAGFGCPFTQADSPRHIGRGRGEISKLQGTGATLREPADLALQSLDAQRILDGNLKALGPNGFNHEIGGTGAHRADDRIDGAMRGLHDHRRGIFHRFQARKHGHPVDIRHHEIEHHRVDPGLCTII